MIQPGDWVCAVDFGTTNTVAAVGDAHGVRPLTINGRTVTPSAVMLQDRGNWLVGDLAVNAARRNLAWFEPRPKSSIGFGTLSLGGRSVPTIDAVAAVLRFVAGEAQQQHSSRPPKRFVVTHPAGWTVGPINALVEAARRASPRTWPNPEPLAEPVAAAQGVLDIAAVPDPARIVVLDLGGGTVDVATVDRSGSVLTVVGNPVGIDEAGGEDFDLRLARLMTAEAGEDRLYEKLCASAEPRDLELALDIRNLARTVKEQLSVEPFVPIGVPVPTPNEIENRPVQISRTQLEDLIKGGDDGPPGLIEAVRLVLSARNQAPPGPPFEGVYLVGGSSRIPLLGRLLQQEIGRPPISDGDPGVAVAEGAAAWALAGMPPGPAEDRAPANEKNNADGEGGGKATPGLVHQLLLAVRSRPRPVLGGLIFGLLVGAAALVVIIGIPKKPIEPSIPSSTTPTAEIPSNLPQPRAETVGVAGCTTAGAPGCAQSILAASRTVWPDMPSDGCSTHESEYGADLYSAECDSGTLSYNVFWRKPSTSILPTLAGQMITPTIGDFRLPDSPDKLGSQVGGTRRTQSEARFTCVWEYADYPVTMVLDGPNDNATVALCESAKFLSPAAMESAIAGH